jgi:hypothetical protein
MGAVDEERHPFTGEVMFRRSDAVTRTRMPEFGTFRATETATAPEAYYVLPEAEDAIERLEAHGISVVRFAQGREASGERFVLDSTSVATTEFQGRRERTVWGRWEPVAADLPPGTAFVSLDQPLGRLAFTLLEPRSDDGFVAWAILDPQIEDGAFPVLRVPATRR